MAAPPQTGTAVKEPARSIVSRMKRRLSAARSSRGTSTGREERTGPAGVMRSRIRAGARLSSSLRYRAEGPRSSIFGFPAILANERNKAAMVKLAAGERVSVLIDMQETLLVWSSDGNNKTPGFGELRCQGRRDTGRCRSDHNGFEGSRIGPAQSPVANMHVHIAIPQA